jgi:hypothetical protein
MPRRTTKIKRKKIEKNNPEAEKYVYPIPEDEGKKFMMWSIIVFFMLVIGVIWFINTKKVFVETQEASESKEAEIDWNKVGQELGGAINELKVGLEEAKVSKEATSSDSLIAGESVSSTTVPLVNSTLTPEQFQEFSGKLKEIQKQVQ